MITRPSDLCRPLADLGIPLPKKAQYYLDLLTEIRRVRDFDARPTARAAIADGSITPDDLADHMRALAHDLLVAERIDEAARTLEDPATAGFYAAIRDAADQLILKLRKPFEDAASIVQEAGRLFPPDATPASVLDGGVQAVQVYEQLGAARTTLGLVRTARVMIGDLTREGEQDATWWITGARDLAHLDEAQRAYSAPGDAFHNLAYAGFTLRLNTTDEARRVSAGAQASSDQQEAREREARAAELRQGWAGWLTAQAG